MIMVFESESLAVSDTGRNVLFREHALLTSAGRNLTVTAAVRPDEPSPLYPQTMKRRTGLPWAC